MMKSMVTRLPSSLAPLFYGRKGRKKKMKEEGKLEEKVRKKAISSYGSPKTFF